MDRLLPFQITGRGWQFGLAFKVAIANSLIMATIVTPTALVVAIIFKTVGT